MTSTILERPVAVDPRDAIRHLFEARSVAVIGASGDPTKLGSSPLVAMCNLGFAGDLHVVNPRHAEMMGHRCYPSVEALPDGIDLAMLIVPAEAAVEAAEACAAKGIRAMVVIAQGFGEAGPEGEQRDARLLALAAQGVAITGPNTNGLANVATGLATSIAPIFQYPGRATGGRISVVSQSGAMVSSLLSRLHQCGLGIAKTVTCGNELVLGAADYLTYLADDPDTDVIVLYLETIRDMPAFRAALACARDAGKPIVAIKVGESESGQKATLSHTGAIAGSYRNTIAFLENEGVYVADDLESLALIAECLFRYDWSDTGKPANRFLASISGGFAAQTADVMERLGIPLQDPTEAGKAALSALPTQSHPVNPYDIAAQNALIPEIIDIFRNDGFDQLLFGLVLLKPAINDQVAALLIEAKARGMDKLFALSPQVDEAERRRFNDAGILLTDNTPALLKALAAIERHRAAGVLRAGRGQLPVIPALALPEGAGLVDEARSKALLGAVGIGTPANVVAPVSAFPQDALDPLRRPVVMKGLSDRIAHKTEHGLVALSLRSDEELRAAWERVTAALAKADPNGNAILIEEMIGSGLEAILGIQRDPVVGPVVVVGAGGILVELLDDAVVLVPPFDVAEAASAIAGTRFGRLLAGYRGQRYDLDALARAVAKLGALALAEPRIESFDINPVLVQSAGEGVIAVDAKVMLGA
ncbi:acetate--CoA ligase family protein [Microvirga sp. SRT01]|uniref:Acetate--CoA ligase family protein n=1 Tax=Sphingomonas longa TaxID=2778730 RepID=A0ABS2DA58_9SPHN|nr:MULTISPECIES: acetate--CoA ligase family protein [Alphaproteobacteria]MBM6577826.1 acetate--CoA ligase family protein [Sphingomonas sp. BT552]MBR7710868.1 acetate--CoA ligase family protein [Microvirga sp. SRT01]